MNVDPRTSRFIRLAALLGCIACGSSDSGPDGPLPLSPAAAPASALSSRAIANGSIIGRAISGAADSVPRRRTTLTTPSYGVEEPSVAVPSDERALDWPGLHHPLVPLPGASSVSEDGELGEALAQLSSEPTWGGTAGLRAFVAARETSRWTLAATLALGDTAYALGRFTEALRYWRSAWTLGRVDTSPYGRAIADQAIAEYAKMNARIGRSDEVRRVLREVELDGRTPSGDAAIKLDSAREGLWKMDHNPGVAFRCGPLALTSVLAAQDPDSSAAGEQFLSGIASPRQGFSLQQVFEMAPRLGLSLTRVWREPKSPITVPSVVHWSVGHFGALVEERDGMFRLVDPTFGNEIWLGAEDVDAESSGYFLIDAAELPEGYRAVDAEEASAIFGKGHSGTTDPDETGPDDHQEGGGDGQCAMATYTFHTLLASLSISDTPITYATPFGPPVSFQVSYNQREASQPLAQPFTQFSPSWVSNWVSYLEDNPAAPSANVRLRQRGGGGAVFTSFSATTQSFRLHTQTQTVLRRLGANTYVLEHADGSRDYYEHFIGTTGAARRVFLSRVSDPHGNDVSLRYSAELPTRLDAIVDAVGSTTTLSYEASGQPFLVTGITDPYGRAARLSYSDIGGARRLTEIEDPFGIVSRFEYDANGGITALTTPYGTTTFELSALKIGGSYELIRFIQATDPEGNLERIEYNLNNAETRAASQVEALPDPTKVSFATSDLDDRNSFFWDKQQMSRARGNYQGAHLYHWVQPDGSDAAMSILESEKPPLEGRIWYNYTGQPAPNVQGSFAQPSVVARVVAGANGQNTTQVSTAAYNARGNPTRLVDPVGRQTEIVYAGNDIDVLEIRQRIGGQSQLLRRFTYDAEGAPGTAHQPIAVTDGSGQTTELAHDAVGRLVQIRDPLGQIVQLSYQDDPAQNGLGKLTSIAGDLPGGDVLFSYDASDRVRTTTDSEGRVLVYDYDELDRVRRVTYPDGTFERFEYEAHSLVETRDRAGRLTRHYENALRQRVTTRDPLGQVSQYEWCLCGELRKLIDGSGNVTEWVRDLQGRVSEKRFAGGRVISFAYDLAGRLASETDAAGRIIRYGHTLDDAIASIDYPGSDTPDVAYTYDPDFPRLATRADGAGLTRYSYHPYNGTTLGAGQLAAIDGPLPDDTVAYAYDELVRVVQSSIGTSGGGAQSFRERSEFDARSRRALVENELGSFTFAFAGQSARVASAEYPNGMRADYSYEGPSGDHRLEQILYRTSLPERALLSRFDYTYNAQQLIERWRLEQSPAGPSTLALAYDAADRVTSALRFETAQTPRAIEHYGYDAAGNRDQYDNGTVRNQAVNERNELLSERGFGRTTVSGTLDEPALVRVNGRRAIVSSDGGDAPYSFNADIELAQGTNELTIDATDSSGNIATRRYAVEAQGVTASYEYDVHGNLRFTRTPDGAVQREYRWDAENRLVAILAGTHETEFNYDGQSHRVRTRERESGRLTSEISHVWCGDRICQDRDATGARVLRSFYELGVIDGGTKHFYTRDHLGSIRELVADDGETIDAQYAYDIWGAPERIGGTGADSVERFTGHPYHAPSGLLLAAYRAYDPSLGRWLSRDPIAERHGPNLYGYVGGDPINYEDPDGRVGVLGGILGATFGMAAVWVQNPNAGWKDYAIAGAIGFGAGFVGAYWAGARGIWASGAAAGVADFTSQAIDAVRECRDFEWNWKRTVWQTGLGTAGGVMGATAGSAARSVTDESIVAGARASAVVSNMVPAMFNNLTHKEYGGNRFNPYYSRSNNQCSCP